MKLVYTATRKPVAIGDEIAYVHHTAPVGTPPKTLTVTDIVKPKHGGSTGRVYAAEEWLHGSGGCFPAVYGMEWIEREDQQQDGGDDSDDQTSVLYVSPAQVEFDKHLRGAAKRR